jgi:hypothetical protein
MLAVQGDELVEDLPPEVQAKWRVRLGEVLALSCTEDTWPVAVRTCIVDAKDTTQVDACGEQLDASAKTRIGERLQPVMEELMKDMNATAAPAEDAEDAAPPPPFDPARLAELKKTKTGIKQCDQYIGAFAGYIACDQVPQEAKDAAMQGVEAMSSVSEQLRDPQTPPEAKKAAADACKQGRDALLQSAQALGCKL